MAANRSTPPGPILLTLIYDDVPKAIEWLCDVFGFTERLRAGSSHAQLSYGDGGIMPGHSRTGQGFAAPDTAQFRQPRPNEVTQIISIHVDDVDFHYENALSRGARILQPPVTHAFGERQYTAEDFAGYRWTFSQTVADVDPKDWGAEIVTPHE